MKTHTLHVRRIGGNLDCDAFRRLTECGAHSESPARTRHAQRCENCNDDSPELRRCASNGGIAWQCRVCGTALSSWLPHAELSCVNIAALPLWQRPHHSSDQLDLFDQGPGR